MSVVDQLNAASLNQASALIGQSCRASPAALTKGRRRRAGLKTRHAIPTRCMSFCGGVTPSLSFRPAKFRGLTSSGPPDNRGAGDPGNVDRLKYAALHSRTYERKPRRAAGGAEVAIGYEAQRKGPAWDCRNGGAFLWR
jgi:hypothetical protein